MYKLIFVKVFLWLIMYINIYVKKKLGCKGWKIHSIIFLMILHQQSSMIYFTDLAMPSSILSAMLVNIIVT